jgi:hypothetical protein
MTNKHREYLARQRRVAERRNASAEAPWKVDDRQWFADHPHRSHRLRPMFSNEFLDVEKSVCSIFGSDEIPEGHSLLVLVRQLEPGERERRFFCHNAEVSILDNEYIIHAIFDLAAGDERAAGDALPTTKIKDLALKYAAAAQRRLS